MPKKCLADNCSYNVFSNGYCRSHQHCRSDSKYLSQKNKPKKLTPIKSNNKPIKKVSKKMQSELSIYRPIRDKFLEDNPECEAKLAGCTFFATEVHHPAGRLGKLLYDITNMKSVCHNCHHIAEINPILAKKLNLSKDRLSK